MPCLLQREGHRDARRQRCSRYVAAAHLGPRPPVPSCPERHKHFPSLSQNLKHSGVKAPLREVL